MRKSLVKFSGLVSSVTRMATVCLRTIKVAIFALLSWKCKYEKYETLSMYLSCPCKDNHYNLAACIKLQQLGVGKLQPRQV